MQGEVQQLQSELNETKAVHDKKVAALTTELEEVKKNGGEELVKDLNKV